MPKAIISILLLFSVFQSSFAQNFGKITGNIKSKTEALEFVTVLLSKKSDSLKVLQNTFTDSTGNFKFDKIEIGEYQLRFSLVGYLKSTKNVTISEQKSDIEIIDFQLSEDGTLLQNVTVTAQKKLIEKTSQGFIVNASANLTQTGGTATDILKNTPTISVDAEGAITMRGKTPQFLINGRASNLANPDQIPASSIESIEIINNASAKYDANSESGIINIRLKKNKSDGTNGAFALGAGLGAKARASSSFLFNHKAQKWNFGLGYDNRFAGRSRKIGAGRTNFNLPETYLLVQNRNDKRVEGVQNLKFNIDFSPNDKNSITFEAIGNTERQDNNEDLITKLYQLSKAFVSNTDRNSFEYERVKVGEFALIYNKEYTQKYKSLTANISSSVENGRQNTDIFSQSYAENNAKIGNEVLERTHNYENGNITSGNLDYAFPIGNNGQIETGYRGVLRSLTAEYQTSKKTNGQYVINTSASNIFDFTENVHAGYIQYNSINNGADQHFWKYTIGLRAENISNSGSNQDASTKFSNNYLQLFPMANITYNLDAESSWKLSYGKRFNRPGFGQLNPFVDITDALNPHSGNSNLKPEIAHNLELGFNKEADKFSVSTNAFYRYTKNTIRAFYQLLPNGVNLNSPINIGNASTAGLETILSSKPSPVCDFNLSVSLFQQHINGANVGVDAVNDAFGWYGKLINNFVPWHNAKLQLIANYNSSLITPQGKRLAQKFVDLGFQQKIHKNGNAKLGVTMVDIFNTLKNGFINITPEFTNFRNVKVDTRAIMVTFGYSFKSAFKDKLLDNKFSREY
jgi:outer membrane receptor protein involved in Fe transport